MQLSAETQTNWMPRVLGSMMLRPGFKYIGGTKSNLAARYIPFIYATADTALLEMTDSVMRVRIGGSLVTRPAVTTAVTNGTFTTNLTGWANGDGVGATSSWKTGSYLSMVGSGFNPALRLQPVTCSGANVGVEHALRIVITNGPVTLRVGTAPTGDNYVAETSLSTGTHSIVFTPTGNFYIQLSSVLRREVLVSSVSFEAAGVLEVPTPWTAADLPSLRYDQSGDVVFVACNGYQQRMIQRRSARSWSVVSYRPLNGPFRNEYQGSTTISPSVLNGNGTFTSSQPYFRTGHVGALFRVLSTGQTVSATLTGADQATDAIRTTGVGDGRNFRVTVSGTWSATVRLQYSIGEVGYWVDAPYQAGYGYYTTNQDFDYPYNDFDNQIVYYRLAIKTGQYTSGSAVCSLQFSGGGVSGVGRVTAYTSPTVVSMEVIEPFGGTSGTDTWAEGAWSDFRGWPTSVALHEGRLWWAGRDNVWGSESDGFESFADTLDGETIGDSNSISRTIGSGPVDVINWLSAGRRLFIGAQGGEKSAQASSLEEPLTPTNFNIKTISTLGSAGVSPVNLDASTLFVQRSGRRLYEISQDSASYDYSTSDLTGLVPDLVTGSIVDLAIQRQPDTRVHAVRSDGTVAVLIMDKVENVICWVEVETNGSVEGVVVLPGTPEDEVYYLISRTIGGVQVRYLEKWALEEDCRGATINAQADSFISYSGASTSTITGLSHLEGERVIVWGDGLDLSPGAGASQATYLVTSGAITLDRSVSNAIVGLPYKAQYKSRKLIEGAVLGVGLTQRKRVDHLGLVLADTHPQGLRYGPNFDTMDALPLAVDYATVDPDAMWTDYDQDSISFPGNWSTDSRVCLEAHAPRPCTVLAMVISMDLHEKTKA